MKNKLLRKIQGSGGGGGGGGAQRVPVEDPDSLRSKAYFRIVDLIAEGEIEGLVNGQKSIYFNETQWQSDDGASNFNGITYEVRNGTQDQSHIDGFSQIEAEYSIGVDLKYIGDSGLDGAVIRQITNPNVDSARVRVSVPALSETDVLTGDVKGSEVTFAVDVQPDGGSYTRVKTRTITGKATSRYEVSVSIPLAGDAPWNIRIVRTTRDSTSQYLQNNTIVDSYTEIINSKLRYPNSAIVALRADAQSFQNIPSRFYDIKGLKIQVPSNYDPETREYSGSWDGTFQTLWSDNPAWIFYDLATAERYGLGGFITASQVDKWTLYQIAQYCDELVPDGFGGTEPRFTCNLVLTDRAEAYTILQSLASVFRSMIYWATGSITLSQDAPQDAAQLYTPSNVVNGEFIYQGSSAKVRNTVALVSWNDPEDFYRLKVEYVEDQAAIVQYGVQETEVIAFGCTSRGQANRFGKWLLYTEQYENEIVTFKTGIEGIVSRPGQVIKVADPVRAGIRFGGRVSDATINTLTVDAMPVGAHSGATLSVVLGTGIEERTIIGQNGNVFTVQPAFSGIPQPQSVWLLRSELVEAQWYRVISIKEEDNGTYLLTALKHDPDKFDAIENDILLEPKNYSLLSQIPETPGDLTATESLYQTGSEVNVKLTISWPAVSGASGYAMRYKFENDNFTEVSEFTYNEKDILDVRPGTYTFEVFSISPLGKRSSGAQGSKIVIGKIAPPRIVDNFSMIPNAGQALLTWNQSSDLDVLVGGKVRIRHTPRTSGQSWKDSIDIIPAVAGNMTSVMAPLLTGTYLARFVDSSGVHSESDALIITTIPESFALNVVHTETEHPDFPGAKTNMLNFEYESEDALVLSSAGLIDDVESIDDLGFIAFTGNIWAEGTYLFENTIDLGGVWPTRIKGTVLMEAFDIGNLIDGRTDYIDTWESVDSDEITDVNAAIYVRTTEDDPNVTPTWTVWKLINAGEYSARGFQFKLVATTISQEHNLFIRELSVALDLVDRVEHFGPLTSLDSGVLSVAYNNPFYAVPAISITANDMGSGDYYTITNADEEGFDIVFMDSTATIVERSFSVLAKGYGRNIA